MVEEYRHSGKAPVRGVLLLGSASILGGAAIGLVMFGSSILIYLVLVFPVVFAFAGFILLGRAVVAGKVRNPHIATLFGVLIGLAIYASFHVAEYYRFSNLLIESISSSIPSDRLANIDRAATVSNILESTTGQRGLLGYLRLTAMEGFSITHLFASEDSGIRLTGTAVYAYWLVEATIIIGLTTAGGRMAGSQPFCEKCEGWFKTLGHFGSIPSKDEVAFINLLRQNDLKEASKLVLNDGDALPPNLELYVGTCKCGSSGQALLSTKKTTIGRDNRVKRKDSFKFLIPYEERTCFDRRRDGD
jgi:hypothetical protein